MAFSKQEIIHLYRKRWKGRWRKVNEVSWKDNDIVAYDMRPHRVRLYGDVAALYFYAVGQTVDSAGEITPASSYRLELLRKVDGSWQLLGGMESVTTVERSNADHRKADQLFSRAPRRDAADGRIRAAPRAPLDISDPPADHHPCGARR